jgi:DUF4097 and DUF4098 domain-containing protein YvlB
LGFILSFLTEITMPYSVVVKYVLSLSALLLISAPQVFAQSSSDAYRTEVFRSGESPDVEIRTSGGFIEVVGHDDNTVRVEMFVKRGNRYLSTSDTDLSDFEIDISQEGGRVIALARSEASGWNWFGSDRKPSISFRVMVPEMAAVDGRTSGGSVTAANLMNGADLRTSGGRIQLDRAAGLIDLRTSGGSISLTDASGTINARTSGGAIRAENSSGRIELRTSGGSIRVLNVAGSISARTSGGSIRAELTELREMLDVRTSGGNISLKIPGPAAYDLDLRGNRVNIDLVEFTGNTSRDRITGSMKGGGIAINARTSGGSVTVEFTG